MTKKEKIAWALATALDNSDKLGNVYIIEEDSTDCKHCGSIDVIDTKILTTEKIEDLYKAYLAAKKEDQGK